MIEEREYNVGGTLIGTGINQGVRSGGELTPPEDPYAEKRRCGHND